MNYASTSNIREVIEFYNLGDKTFETDFNKCGIVMASSGNIYRGIQLIIDVIDCKMLKGKYLVSMLSAHPMS